MTYRMRGKSYDGLGQLTALSPLKLTTPVTSITPTLPAPPTLPGADIAQAKAVFDSIVPASCPGTYNTYQAPPGVMSPGDTLFMIYPIVKWDDAGPGGSTPWKTFIDMVGYAIEVHDRLYQTGFNRGNKDPAWLPQIRRMGVACTPTAKNFRDHPDAVCAGFPLSWKGPPAVVRAGMGGFAAPGTKDSPGLYYQDPPWMAIDNNNPLTVTEGRWNGSTVLGPFGPILAGWIPRPGNGSSTGRGVIWVATGIVGSETKPTEEVAALLRAIATYASKAASFSYMPAGLPVLGTVPMARLVVANQGSTFGFAVPARGLRTDDLLFSLERTDDADTAFGFGGRQDDLTYKFEQGDINNLYGRLTNFQLFEGYLDPSTMLDATGRRHGAHTRRGAIADAIVSSAADAAARTVEGSLAGFAAALRALIVVPGGVNNAVSAATGDIVKYVNNANGTVQQFGTLAEDARTAQGALRLIGEQIVAAIGQAQTPEQVDQVVAAGKAALATASGRVVEIGRALRAYADPALVQAISAAVQKARTQLTPEKILALAASSTPQYQAGVASITWQAGKDALNCEMLKQLRDNAGRQWVALGDALQKAPLAIANVQAMQMQIPAAQQAVDAVQKAVADATTALHEAQTKRDTELGLAWWQAHWHGLPMYAWLGMGGAAVVGGLVVARKLVKRGRSQAAAAPATQNARRRRRSTRRPRLRA